MSPSVFGTLEMLLWLTVKVNTLLMYLAYYVRDVQIIGAES